MQFLYSPLDVQKMNRFCISNVFFHHLEWTDLKTALSVHPSCVFARYVFGLIDPQTVNICQWEKFEIFLNKSALSTKCSRFSRFESGFGILLPLEVKGQISALTFLLQRLAALHYSECSAGWSIRSVFTRLSMGICFKADALSPQHWSHIDCNAWAY